MSLTVISMWYNESTLAPLWCDHYLAQGAVQLSIIIDEDSTDDCRDIAWMYGAAVSTRRFEDGLDDMKKVAWLTELAKQSSTEYVLIADADEFVYSDSQRRITDHIGRCDVYYVDFWQTYRHRSEGPLDERLPLNQRRHGSLNPYNEKPGHWRKPSIVRVSKLKFWTPGHHKVSMNGQVRIGKDLVGAHWAMADVELAIDRRIFGRRDRMSAVNRKYKWTTQHWGVTEEQIRHECEAHLNDPLMVLTKDPSHGA